MATLSSIITPTNITTASNTQTLTNKTLTGAAMNGTLGATTPSTVAATTISATSTITPSQTAGIVGTTTNNNANAGSVGEYVTATLASGSAHTMTAAVTDSVTSISLTAGDWDVSAVGWWVVNASATYYIWFGVGTSASGNPGSAIGAADNLILSAGAAWPATANYDAVAIPPVRFSLASTTTIYLTAQSNFTGTANTCFGSIHARRVR